MIIGDALHRTLVKVSYRDMPALENVPVNDRRGDLTGLWLETSDRLQSAHCRPKTAHPHYQYLLAGMAL